MGEDAELQNLELAAIMWWRSHRPVIWTEAQHLETPMINCPNDGDKALAMAVANRLKVFRATWSQTHD